MIDIRGKIKPDLVFMPAPNDIHQDHHTIYQEGLRAFKFSTIFCYEMPWNNLSFNTTAFVELEDRHVEKKLSALKAYKSQEHRPYSSEEFIRGFAKTRGVQINKSYAEAFEALRVLL
jgi:LmbE family N-acetylglucosaminyl deacetylase